MGYEDENLKLGNKPSVYSLVGLHKNGDWPCIMLAAL
jgi:hypothetical protein